MIRAKTYVKKRYELIITNIVILITLNSFDLYSIAAAQAADNGGLQIAIAADILADFNQGRSEAPKSERGNDRFDLRSAEIMFYSPIDHIFDGYFSIAAHPESSDSFGTAEVHEAYISSSGLIPRSRFKLGQFFLGTNRTNYNHQHDWPFITAPLMLKRIFNSEEGVIDRGAEFSTLLDLPFYLDLSIGLTMGNEFGHSHERQMLAKTPTHYMRIATFYNLANTNISNGLSYLGRTSSEQAKLQIWTVDLLAKKRIARRVSWLTQAEAAYKTTKIKFGESTTEFSAYIYQQYGLNQ